MAAAQVERMMGFSPSVFTSLEEMAAAVPGLQAVDVVVDPCFHEEVVCNALDLGLHVMVEKPMAITVKGCLAMMEAARRNGRLLSVAENFRREPLCEAGQPSAAGGQDRHSVHGHIPPHERRATGFFITPWRHLKDRGGMVLDVGVHFTDLIRYQLGDIDEVYGDVRLVEPVRRKPEGTGIQNEFYRKRLEEMADQYPATAEDVSIASMRLESGAFVSWMVGIGGHGGCGGEMIFGDEGAPARLRKPEGAVPA